MTKKGLPAIALALVAALAFSGAAVAASGSQIKLSNATKLARKLAQKQVSNRHIVSYHVLDARRRGRNAVTFTYDDRSATNIYCTATLVVTRHVTATKTTLSARFRNQNCRPVPADALAVESATKNATNALRGTNAATTRSLAALNASLKRCRKLDVPRARRATASAIADIATVEAIERPSDAVLAQFVDTLGHVSTDTPALTAGIAGWSDYLATIRALPPIPDPCATLTNWAKNGYDVSKSPIDVKAYNALDRRSLLDRRAILRAAAYLARVGVFPRTVLDFTTEGLLLRAGPSVRPAAAARKPALL